MGLPLLSLSSLAPRALAVAASGAVHAAVFASLLLTAQGHSATRQAVLPVDVIESVEELPAPDISQPAEPAANRVAAPEPHHHPYPVPSSHDARPHDPSLTHAPAKVSEEAAPSAQPEAIATPAEAPARFAIVIPVIAGAGAVTGRDATAASSGVGRGPSPDATYSESAVSRRAKVLSSVAAAYPPQARSAEVEADVPLEIVVDASGHVIDARVLTRAGYGFDEAALTAIRSYRFAPAEREGHAVRVRMRWSVQFRLR